jgi:hypothetical protein
MMNIDDAPCKKATNCGDRNAHETWPAQCIGLVLLNAVMQRFFKRFFGDAFVGDMVKRNIELAA